MKEIININSDCTNCNKNLLDILLDSKNFRDRYIEDNIRGNEIKLKNLTDFLNSNKIDIISTLIKILE